MAPMTLVRKAVPADNNCLFSALAHLASSHASPATLRTIVADATLDHSDHDALATMLGHTSVEEYVRWIVDQTHWGGEPELLALARHYALDVHLVSCETLRTTRYAADAPTRTAFLLYTGQHYDPLVPADAETNTPLPEPSMPYPLSAEHCAALGDRAIALAREHNAERERRAKEKRVKRIKCGGCGAIVVDTAGFEAHCLAVEHDDDFAYECEQVEVVLQGGDEMPPDHVDLESPETHAFYNAASPTELSLSMMCVLAPFEVAHEVYPSLENRVRSDAVSELPAAERDAALLEAVRSQYSGDAALDSGLRAHLLATGTKYLACVDVDSWLGIQALEGVSTGRNALGVALMKVRDELRAASVPIKK